MIRVNVDPTNPGQFFACCGLLELADRLWPGAEGWFEKGEFCVECEGGLPTLLAILVKDLPTPILTLEVNGLEVPPIIAPLAFQLRWRFNERPNSRCMDSNCCAEG